MTKAAVRLHDLGICCALGASQQEVLERVLRGDQSGMQTTTDSLTDGTATKIGKVQATLPDLSAFSSKYQSRNNQIALHCLQQIEASVAAVKAKFGSHRVAVVVGTSTSGIAEGERALSASKEHNQLPPNYDYGTQEMGALAEFVQLASGVSGPAFAISTACSSSAQALISARELIQSGLADAVICGGVDSMCRLTLNGFKALESLDSEQCQPFSLNRKGINIGEGGALFVMTAETEGICLVGAGSAADAHHMSAPHPQGRGAIAAITQACREAQIEPSELGYINLHGTATPLNDAMESYVMHELGAGRVPASSTKSLTGHTLGAAGAIEAGICWLLLSSQNSAGTVAPHSYDGAVDPELKPLLLADKGTKLARKMCLSNSFAFGGSNVSLIIGSLENV